MVDAGTKKKRRRKSVLEGFLHNAIDDGTFEKASRLADSISSDAPEEEHSDVHGTMRSKEHGNVPGKVCGPVVERVVKGHTDDHALYQTDDHAPYHTQIPDTLPQTVPDTGPHTLPRTLPHTGQHTLPRTRQDPSIKNVYLSKQQSNIYDFLLKNGPEGFMSSTQIKNDTGITKNTVHKSLIRLKEKGVLDYKRYQKEGRQGFTYTININIPIEWSGKKPKGNTPYHTQGDTLYHAQGNAPYHTQSGAPYHAQGDTPSAPYISSSSFFYKNTTAVEIEAILTTHPELGYWRQKGLSPKQILEWMKTAECSLENIIQYLCYCRFDMVDTGLEKSKPIENVFNWFFRVLEKSGGYPKPKEYKSHQEKQIEQERAAVTKKEREIEDLKKIWRQKYEKEREFEFWQMMNDPEGEGYKKCFDRLNNFMKKKEKKGGPAFEAAMRAAFDEMMEASDGGDEQNSDDQNNPPETGGE